MNSKRMRYGMMVVILLVATWLRVHRLAEIPPGIHFDEAANGLLAGDIGLRGARPIFITAYTGKETLFFYLAGSLMFLLGQNVFVLRLTAAFVGLLMISATERMCRELFPHSRSIGVCAALLVATNFGMVLFGRLGFRAITQPLLQTLTIAALLYGARTGKRRGFVMGGLCLGLTGYTYLAARLFPIVIGLIIICLAINAQKTGRLSSFIRHTSYFLVIASLTIAPLLWFFWHNPDAFWVRIDQVSGDVGWRDYVGSYAESLGMLAVKGDPYWRFNIPFMPLLNWAVVVGSAVGIGMMAWQRRWFPLTIIVVGVGVMLLPTALAIGEITPSNLRAIGVFPFVLLPCAYALDRLMMIARRDTVNRVSTGVMIGLLFGLTAIVYNDYFQAWANREDVFYETEADLLAVADYIDEADETERLFVASKHYQHPSLAFASARYDQIEWLIDGEAFVAPKLSPNDRALIVYPAGIGVPDWAENLLPTKRDVRQEFMAYQLDEAIDVAWETAVNSNFSDVITLDGVTITQTDHTVSVRLFWTVNAETERDVIPFVHLEDQDGYRWVQNDSIGFLAAQWRPGDRIIYNIDLDIPEGMPTAAYRLQIGLVDSEGERLSVVDDASRFAGTTAIVEDIFVEGNSDYDGQMPPVSIDKNIVDSVRLLGHEGMIDTAESGAFLPMVLWWATERDVAVDLLLGDVLLATWDVSAAPFTIDRQRVRIPAEIPSGTYPLRLRVDDGEILLEEIGVVKTDRMLVRPDVATVSNALFNHEIGLVGYTIDGTQLTLVWEALRAPDDDYTVFVHLLEPDGTCCVWQQDAQPRQNSYPTSRWVEGEFVVDVWEMTLPEITGTYPIEIGLYVAETGERLIVRSLDENSADHVYLSPIIVP